MSPRKDPSQLEPESCKRRKHTFAQVVTVAIPTYGREQVLLDTVRDFLGQEEKPGEILILDQTPEHQPRTGKCLAELHEKGMIRWLRLKSPSQPAALNRALLEARCEVVLFCDDDIIPGAGLVREHAAHYHDPDIWAVAGQVLQPGQNEASAVGDCQRTGPFADLDFPFNFGKPTRTSNAMSGNLSVRRDKALGIGGFDENFVPPVSYRFDAEFCKRLCREGGTILFEPGARVHHLRIAEGGTRTQGNHLTSSSPVHGVGDYYFALRQGITPATVGYMLQRPFRQVRTRFHLKHPWHIPLKLVGEARAFAWALKLYRQEPKLLS